MLKDINYKAYDPKARKFISPDCLFTGWERGCLVACRGNERRKMILLLSTGVTLPGMDTELVEGDILRVPVKRGEPCSGKDLIHHRMYLNMIVFRCDFGSFMLKPLSENEMDELAKPKGEERCTQLVNYPDSLYSLVTFYLSEDLPISYVCNIVETTTKEEKELP